MNSGSPHQWEKKNYPQRLKRNKQSILNKYDFGHYEAKKN